MQTNRVSAGIHLLLQRTFEFYPHPSQSDPNVAIMFKIMATFHYILLLTLKLLSSFLCSIYSFHGIDVHPIKIASLSCLTNKENILQTCKIHVTGHISRKTYCTNLIHLCPLSQNQYLHVRNTGEKNQTNPTTNLE